jgi:hypothetical protein
MEELLPRKHKALNSNPSTDERENKIMKLIKNYLKGGRKIRKSNTGVNIWMYHNKAPL